MKPRYLVAFASVFLLLASPATSQAPVMALDDDATASGFGGSPPRFLTPASSHLLTIRGPVGHFAFFIGGARLEPGIPVAGSPFPIHVAAPIDLTAAALGGGLVPLAEGHVVDGDGRLEVGLAFPSLPAGVLPLRFTIQSALVAPTFTQVMMTNPIELELDDAGAPASVEVSLAGDTVEEADEGGVLTVGAVVRDANGRLVTPTPPFQVMTSDPSATFPAPEAIAFPDEGGFDVTVTLTASGLAGTRPVRVAPEVIEGQFVDYSRDAGQLMSIAAEGLRALGRGDTAAASAAVSGLTAGLQNLPAVANRPSFVPLCSAYPSVADLIASGAFPANPDDPTLANLLGTLTSALQDLTNFLRNTPLNNITFDDLAELGERAEEIENVVDLIGDGDFSLRELWSRRFQIQFILNRILPEALQEALQHAKEAIDAANQAIDFGRSLSKAFRSLGVAGLALRVYQPFLEQLAVMGSQLALHGLIDYLLQNIATLDLCFVCGASCSFITDGITVNLIGTGFGGDPSCHRVLVVSASQDVNPVMGALSGHDTIPDFFEAVANLEVLFPSTFFSFAPDAAAQTGQACGDILTVNSWPIANGGFVPIPITVIVLRLDAGISTPLLVNLAP